LTWQGERARSTSIDENARGAKTKAKKPRAACIGNVKIAGIAYAAAAFVNRMLIDRCARDAKKSR
jgi:hypothetical protein